MESPAFASAPSPSTRSSMTSSVGAASPGKSISGLVVVGSKPMMVEPFSRRSRSDDCQDVDNEHQRVLRPDQRRGALGAVTFSRGNDQQDAAADGRSDQALVPARDDLAGADLSVER